METAGGEVDLHTHSTFSDGQLTPTELVRRAKAMGLRAVALTDHDNIDGVAEAVEAGAAEGIEVIPGVELSVEYREFKDVHLLGYYVDWRSTPLAEKLRNFQEVRESRGERILQRINDHLIGQGIHPMDFAEVRAAAHGSVGRPHIAQKLVEKGLARAIDDAFDRYLVPYNVPKAYFTPTEAVKMVDGARGVVVLAHPMVLTKDRNFLNLMLADFKELGVSGLEAYYGDFAKSEISACRKLAQQHGLVATGGSDFHGEGFPFRLGRLRDNQAIPYQVVRDLRRAFFARFPMLIGICGLDSGIAVQLVREAARQIDAEAILGDLSGIRSDLASRNVGNRSVVALVTGGGIEDVQALEVLGAELDLRPCLVWYDRDQGSAWPIEIKGYPEAGRGGGPPSIKLALEQIREESPGTMAEHLLHMVALLT